MRKVCLFPYLLILLYGCQSKSNHEKEINQDTLIMDYFQNTLIDTTAMIEGVSSYVAYPRLKIAGKTLSEIVYKYGLPESNDAFDLDTRVSFEKGTLHDVLSFILQKFHSPIKIHVFRWKPYKNKELILSIYFIDRKGTLEVIYGEQSPLWMLQLE